MNAVKGDSFHPHHAAGVVNTHDQAAAEDIHPVALSHEAVVSTEILGVGIANEDSLHSVYIHGSCDNFVHELKSI